jgi:hypothetical protein
MIMVKNGVGQVNFSTEKLNRCLRCSQLNRRRDLLKMLVVQLDDQHLSLRNKNRYLCGESFFEESKKQCGSVFYIPVPTTTNAAQERLFFNRFLECAVPFPQ